MPYPDRVIARMVSPLWSQLAATAPPTPVGGNVGGVGTPPVHFGIPERIPELTFNVEALPDDNGFITTARAYHTAYGLNPQNFTSLESLLTALRTPSSHIGRLRIIGHAGLSRDNDANLNAAFFIGGPRIIRRAMLHGFGISDEAGLRSILDETNFLNPTAPLYANNVVKMLRVLEHLHPEVIAPFGINTGSTLSGDFHLLIITLTDILFAFLGKITANGIPISNSNRTTLKASLRLLYNIVRDRVSGTTIPSAPAPITTPHLDTLRTTVEGINNIEMAFLSNNFPIFGNRINPILVGLRSETANATLLSDFCLQTNRPPTGSQLEKFMKICSDLVFVTNVPVADLRMDGTPLSGSQKTSLLSALNAAADIVRDSMAGTSICGGTTLTNTRVDNLRTAILALSLADMNLTHLGTSDTPSIGSYGYSNAGTVQIFNYLNTANAAIGRDFRTKINAVKARFDENSWIDIRGCRIGQDLDYLDAIRFFFGRTDHLPSVSGPEWFQSFPVAGMVPLNNEAAIDTCFGTGDNSQNQNHTSQQIQDRFNEVRDLIGLGIHMDFWERVSDLSNFAFAAQIWKGDLPVLPIEAPRLAGFAGLDFSDTINRVSEIFNLTASRPTGATLTRIENTHAAMAALQTEIDTIQRLAGQATPVVTELESSHQRLHTISQQLGLTVVPATPPAGLTAAQLQAIATQLQTHFETVVIANGAANNAEMTTFRQALHAKVRISRSTDAAATGNARSDFRYFFMIGLPLLLEPLNSWFFYILSAHINQALRSFMKANWEDDLPAGNQVGSATAAQDKSRQLSVLTETDDARIDIDDHVNPYPEFNQHIATRP